MMEPRAVAIVVFDAVFDNGPGFMMYAVPAERYSPEMTEAEAEEVSLSAPSPLVVPDDFFND